MTAALPAPELREPVLDPALAVDPRDPDRVVVVAGYGDGPSRATRGIWTWATENGGRAWTGASMPLPRASAIRATDPAVVFDGDGRALLTFAFADSGSGGGAAVASTGRRDLQFGPARRLVPDRVDDGTGAVALPRLVHDRSSLSPLRSSLYLSWLYASADSSVLWVASTRGQPAPWREGNRIASGAAGTMATRSDGALEVIVLDQSGRTISRTSSADGGLSFAHPDPVVSRPDAIRIHHPMAATGAGDTTVVCWSETMAARPGAPSGWCARGTESGWDAPVAVPTDGRPDPIAAVAAVAAGAGGFWLLTYHADGATTEVRLHRSIDGGRTFERFRVLGSRPFGHGALCFATVPDCGPTAGRFFPGARAGLAAAGDRVYAVYLLPDGDLPDGRPTAFFTALRGF